MEWISVKDRLPEKDGWYFVFAPGYWGNNRIYGLEGLACSNFKHNYKEHWGIERSGVWKDVITHWMPMPEAPQK